MDQPDTGQVLKRLRAKKVRSEALDQNAGRIGCVPLAGGKVRWLAQGLDTAGFAADREKGYWATGGKLWAAPIGGGAKEELASFSMADQWSSPMPQLLSARAGRVVWVQDGSLYLLGPGGASQRLVGFTWKDHPEALAQTAHAAYWEAAGNLWSAPLP